jgi:hypothetical protein
MNIKNNTKNFAALQAVLSKACASKELQLDEARDQVEDPADVEAEQEAEAGPSSGGRKGGSGKSARGRPRRGRKVQFSPLITKKCKNRVKICQHP